MTTTTTGTRQRLVQAMSRSLQRRGMNGSGLTDLLAAAEVPKGVLYHHFPAGKAELTVAAIAASAEQIVSRLEATLGRSDDAFLALRAWMQAAEKSLSGSAFEAGCPLATVALESTSEDVAIREALASAFAAIRASIADALVRAGETSRHAGALAALIVATYEGGLIQARVAGSAKPMTQAMTALVALLEADRSRGARE